MKDMVLIFQAFTLVVPSLVVVYSVVVNMMDGLLSGFSMNANATRR